MSTITEKITWHPERPKDVTNIIISVSAPHGNIVRPRKRKNPIRWKMQTGDLANKKMDLRASLERVNFYPVSNFLFLYLFIYHLLSDHADGVNFPPIILAKHQVVSTC